jgi:hypothetical protein
MSETAIPWPPQIGDHVQIVTTGAVCVVMGGDGVRRFQVGIYSHTLGSVTTAPYRTFMLSELGPPPTPQIASLPAPAGRQRRAKQQEPSE